MLMEASNTWCRKCAELQQTLQEKNEQANRNFTFLKEKIISSESDLLSYKEKLKNQPTTALLHNLNKDITRAEAELNKKNEELKCIQQEKEKVDKLVKIKMVEIDNLKDSEQKTNGLNQQLVVSLKKQETDYDQQNKKIKQLQRQIEKLKNNNNNSSSSNKCQKNNNQAPNKDVKSEIANLLELALYFARILEKNSLIPKKTNTKVKKLFQDRESLLHVIEENVRDGASQFREILSIIGINKENICTDDDSEDEADGDLLSQLLSQDDAINTEDSISRENAVTDVVVSTPKNSKVSKIRTAEKYSPRKNSQSQTKPAKATAKISSELPTPENVATSSSWKQPELRTVSPVKEIIAEKSPEPPTISRNAIVESPVSVGFDVREDLLTSDDESEQEDSFCNSQQSPNVKQKLPCVRDEVLPSDNHTVEIRPLHLTKVQPGHDDIDEQVRTILKEMNQNINLILPLPPSPHSLASAKKCKSVKSVQNGSSAVEELETVSDSPTRTIAKRKHTLPDHRRQCITPVSDLSDKPKNENYENAFTHNLTDNDCQRKNILRVSSCNSNEPQKIEFNGVGNSSQRSLGSDISEPIFDPRPQKSRISLCNGLTNPPGAVKRLKDDMDSLEKVVKCGKMNKKAVKRKLDSLDSFLPEKCVRLDSDKTIDAINTAAPLTNGLKCDSPPSVKMDVDGVVFNAVPEKLNEGVNGEMNSVPSNSSQNKNSKKKQRPKLLSNSFAPVRSSTRIRPVTSVCVRKAAAKSEENANAVKENGITPQPLNGLAELDSATESKDEHSTTKICDNTLLDSVWNASEQAKKDEVFYECRAKKKRISLCNTPVGSNGQTPKHCEAELSLNPKIENGSSQKVDVKEEILSIGADQIKMINGSEEKIVDNLSDIDRITQIDKKEEEMLDTWSSNESLKTSISAVKEEKSKKAVCDVDMNEVKLMSDAEAEKKCDGWTDNVFKTSINGFNQSPAKSTNNVEAKNTIGNGYMPHSFQPNTLEPLPKILFDWINHIISQLSNCKEDFDSTLINTRRKPKFTSYEEHNVQEMNDKINTLCVKAKKNFYETLLEKLLGAIFPASRNQLRGRIALCRFFSVICRITGNLERARVLCYDLLCLSTSTSGYLIAHMIAVWSKILCSRDSTSICDAIQFTLLRLEVGLTANQRNYLNSAFSDKKLPPTCDDIITAFITQLSVLTERGHTTMSPGVYDVQKSIELIATVKGWSWTSFTLIAQHLEPKLEEWKKTVDKSPFDDKNDSYDTFTEIIVTIMSLVCRNCPDKQNRCIYDLMKFLNSVLEIASKFSSQRKWYLQEALVEAIMLLKSFNTEIASLVLREWLPRNKVKVSLRLKSLMDKVAEEFKRAPPKYGRQPNFSKPHFDKRQKKKRKEFKN